MQNNFKIFQRKVKLKGSFEYTGNNNQNQQDNLIKSKSGIQNEAPKNELEELLTQKKTLAENNLSPAVTW